MGSFSKNIALLSIGFWLGCTILFAAVVAPTLFNPDVASGLSRSLAGSISGAILRRIHIITYISIGTATFFLLAASFGDAKISTGPRRALILCILILGLNAAGDFWIMDHINKIRLQMNNSEESQALLIKKEFDYWHKISTGVYGTGVVLGIVGALFLLPAAHSPGKKAGGGKGKK